MAERMVGALMRVCCWTSAGVAAGLLEGEGLLSNVPKWDGRTWGAVSCPLLAVGVVVVDGRRFPRQSGHLEDWESQRVICSMRISNSQRPGCEGESLHIRSSIHADKK